MSSFPLVYLLLPFAAVFLFSLVFFFFNVFHIARYGIRQTSTKAVLGLYFVSYGLMLLVVLGYLSTIDWSQRFSAEDLLPGLSNGSTYGL